MSNWKKKFNLSPSKKQGGASIRINTVHKLSITYHELEMGFKNTFVNQPRLSHLLDYKPGQSNRMAFQHKKNLRNNTFVLLIGMLQKCKYL